MLVTTFALSTFAATSLAAPLYYGVPCVNTPKSFPDCAKIEHSPAYPGTLLSPYPNLVAPYANTWYGKYPDVPQAPNTGTRGGDAAQPAPSSVVASAPAPSGIPPSTGGESSTSVDTTALMNATMGDMNAMNSNSTTPDEAANATNLTTTTDQLVQSVSAPAPSSPSTKRERIYILSSDQPRVAQPESILNAKPRILDIPASVGRVVTAASSSKLPQEIRPDTRPATDDTRTGGPRVESAEESYDRLELGRYTSLRNANSPFVGRPAGNYYFDDFGGRYVA